MAKKIETNPLLKELPLHIYRQNSTWYRNSKTGELIHKDNLAKHVPVQPDPNLQEKRWDLNY